VGNGYLIQAKMTASFDESYRIVVYGIKTGTGGNLVVGDKFKVQSGYAGKPSLESPYVLFDKFKNTSNWVVANADYTQKTNMVHTHSVTNSFANFSSNNLNFSGSQYSTVSIRWKRLVGDSPMEFRWYYPSSSEVIPFDEESNNELITTIPDGQYYITTFDFSGHSQWIDRTIRNVRVDVGQIPGDEYELDSIKVYSSSLLEGYANNWPATYIPPKSLNEVTASAYIPTQATHAERSINGQQDVLIAEQTTGLSGGFSHKFANLRSNAGVYFVKLNSDVKNASNGAETISYTTQDILAQRNPEAIHVGAFSLFGAAGSPALNAMDSATFDIDRFPLISESGSQGIEDSDGFKADDIEGDAYETNAPNDVSQSSPGVYFMAPTGIDVPTGNQNQHYKMYISAGQLYQGGSMYSGNVRLDVGIQSQEESE
jgi:hypothetical protein